MTATNTLAEKILLKLSKDPQNNQPQKNLENWAVDNALDNLYEVFDGFDNYLSQKKVLDFGSGLGYQAVAMAQKGASEVLGVDINEENIAHSRKLAQSNGVAEKIVFKKSLAPEDFGSFDVAISQNSMEHFSKPAAILTLLNKSLKPGGLLFITFGPPWFAPFGSHMSFFTNCPWVNILFSEKTVMNVRKHFRDDGAQHYEDVENGLNKMSIDKFERLIQEQKDLQIHWKQYDTVKKIPMLDKIPGIRELFINRVNCILKKIS